MPDMDDNNFYVMLVVIFVVVSGAMYAGSNLLVSKPSSTSSADSSPSKNIFGRKKPSRLEPISYFGPEITTPERPKWSAKLGEIEKEKYILKRQAEINVKVKMVDLIPVTVLVGWGPLSNTENIEHLNIPGNYDGSETLLLTCGGRILPRMAMENSAQIHLIADGIFIEEDLKKIQRGDVIRLKGNLVRVLDKKSRSKLINGVNSRKRPWGGNLVMSVEAIEFP